MNFTSLEVFTSNPELVKFLAILIFTNSILIASINAIVKAIQNSIYQKSNKEYFNKFSTDFEHLTLRINSYMKGTAEELTKVMELTQELFVEFVKFKDENIGKRVNNFLKKYINSTLEKILIENIMKKLERNKNSSLKEIKEIVTDTIDTYIHTYLQDVEILSNFNYEKLHGITNIIIDNIENSGKVDIETIKKEVCTFIQINFIRK